MIKKSAAPEDFGPSEINEPSTDKLIQARDLLRTLRDAELRKVNAEATLKEVNKEIQALTFGTIPDFFTANKIRGLDLEPEGNQPGYSASILPYFKANIPVDWPEAKRAAAFKWLRENEHGSLIKTIYTVEFGRGEDAGAIAFESLLASESIPFTKKLGIPWTTLTAFVKEQVTKYGRALPLETLGATVGKIVTLKQKD